MALAPRMPANADVDANDADAGDDAAAEVEALFRAIYLRFHRRDRKQAELPGASRAVLLHLAQTGPLTIGEAAAHLERAQSVVSGIVNGLEKKGLLERIRDPKDKRRTLVWLTERGLARMADDRRVLSRDLLARALATIPADTRGALLAGMRALAGAPDVAAHDPPSTEPRAPREPRTSREPRKRGDPS